MVRLKQLINYYIFFRRNNEVKSLYDYLVKVARYSASPSNYKETLYEDELKYKMEQSSKSREESAAILVKHFATKLPPFSFNKREYKKVLKKMDT